ncbi:hypothetical protein B5F25_00350 [Bacteroides sp. An19]|nr:hypothetical protein B5F25_00350 [Bacteroides sp. An19]
MGKYSKDMVQACADWVRENGLIDHGGATLTDFCRAMGIDDMSYYNWMKRSEFSESIKKAKEAFRESLEKDIVKSLANAAKGYEYTQTTTEYTDVNGKPRVKKQVKKNIRVEPNVGAAIFLLTNIAPERWKNRQNQEVNISNEKPITVDEAKKIINEL